MLADKPPAERLWNEKSRTLMKRENIKDYVRICCSICYVNTLPVNEKKSSICVELIHDSSNIGKERKFTLAPEFKKDENGVKKLIQNLDDKKYIIHHKILKEYLKDGIILESEKRKTI